MCVCVYIYVHTYVHTYIYIYSFSESSLTSVPKYYIYSNACVFGHALPACWTFSTVIPLDNSCSILEVSAQNALQARLGLPL